MIRATGSAAPREGGTRWSNLYFNGDERKYELWEFKFLGYLRLLGLKAAILGEPDKDQGERNKEAFAELIQVLDDKSLSLVWREAADDGRKALKILREHYTGVHTSSLSPGLKPETPETPQIKEDVVEVIIKEEEEQLPVSVPESSADCVKREESSLRQHRQTEHREETQDSSETERQTEHFPDTDNGDAWEPPGAPAARSTGMFPQNTSAPETSASVNEEDLPGAEGAEGKTLQCPFCFKRFRYNLDLIRHVRVHTGERPYSCSICVQTPSLSPGLDLKQEIPETPQIKEEEEEQSVKQEEEQLPVSVPESSAVYVKSEESSLLQLRQTEHRDKSQGEGSSESEGQTEHSSDTDNDDKWEPSSPPAARSTGLFPKYKSAPETSASVHEEDLSGAEGAEEKKHQCSVCQKRFGTKQILQRHIRVHTGERPYSCHICKQTFIQKSNLTVHMRIHTGGRPYSCAVCNKTFAQKGNLTEHLTLHTKDRPFSCSACNKTFFRESALTVHMRYHSGERPFSCSVCNKTFVQKKNLTEHVRVHTGAKPYSCTVCNRTFAQQSTLAEHERTHTGDKPFSCSVCGTTFKQSGHLTTHMRTHTGEKPYSCTVCKGTFKTSSNLTSHMRTHTGERPYSCTVCEKAYADKRGLKAHMGKHTD